MADSRIRSKKEVKYNTNCLARMCMIKSIHNGVDSTMYYNVELLEGDTKVFLLL